jgi:hypothetical protein
MGEIGLSSRAESARYENDEADHQNQAKRAAPDYRAAKIKPAAAEQQKKNKQNK